MSIEQKTFEHMLKHRRIINRFQNTLDVVRKCEEQGLVLGDAYRGALLELNSCYRALLESEDRMKELWAEVEL